MTGTPPTDLRVLPWWERTYAIPRWLVWLAIPSIAIHAVLGIHSLVVWFS